MQTFNLDIDFEFYLFLILTILQLPKMCNVTLQTT